MNRLRLSTLAFFLLPWAGGCLMEPNPNRAPVLQAMAEARVAAGDRERAIAFYAAAADADPDAIEIRHSLARLLLAKGDGEEALRRYGEILHLAKSRTDPSAKEAFASAGAGLIAGQLQRADKAVTTALARYPGDLPLLLTRAIVRYRRKDFDGAAEAILAARQIAAKRNGDDGFESPAGKKGHRFPHAVPRMLAGIIVRQYFRDRFARGSATPGAGKVDAKMLAEKAVAWFPKWGFAHAAHASVLSTEQESKEKERRFRRALTLSPGDLDVARRARLFFVRRGAYADARDIWRRMMPMNLLLAPRNRLRDRFAALAEASRAAEKVRSEKTLLSLARAYDRVGWTEEAVATARSVVRQAPQSERGKAALAKLEAHWKFLTRFRTEMRAAYRKALKGRALPDSRDILAALEKAGGETGAVRFDAEEEIESFFLAGSEYFPFRRLDTRLTKYLRSHGHYLSLTQGWGAPIVKWMNLVYWEETTWRVPGGGERMVPFAWAVGDEGRIMSFAGFVANYPRIAGLTGISADGFLVDAKSLRPLNPPDTKTDDEETDLLRRAAANLQKRILAELDAEANGKHRFEKLFAARIDKVSAHEFGHVVDLRNHLPFYAHLPSNLWLVIRNRFSTARIRARAEIVAEAASLARSANPYLVVRDNLLWMAKIPESPYWTRLVRPRLFANFDSPYRAAGRAMLEEIVARAKTVLKADGRLTRTVPAVLQLHKLSPDELREIGAAISRSHGLN